MITKLSVAWVEALLTISHSSASISSTLVASRGESGRLPELCPQVALTNGGPATSGRPPSLCYSGGGKPSRQLARAPPGWLEGTSRPGVASTTSTPPPEYLASTPLRDEEPGGGGNGKAPAALHNSVSSHHHRDLQEQQRARWHNLPRAA